MGTQQLTMESMNTALQQQRLEVEQLRREAAMKRIPVSQAVEDIKAYIRDHNQEDCLLTGFHGKNSNPFRENLHVKFYELALVSFINPGSRIFQCFFIYTQHENQGIFCLDYLIL